MDDDSAERMISLLESIDSKLDALNSIRDAVEELRMDLCGFEHNGQRSLRTSTASSTSCRRWDPRSRASTRTPPNWSPGAGTPTPRWSPSSASKVRMRNAVGGHGDRVSPT